MADQKKFVVDTYQINVGAGDCSIHILAENPSPEPSGKRGTVLRAVIIDGGKVAGASNYIKNAIASISAEYNFPGTQTSLTFDSIIVSHWDVDHYQGLLDLLRSDLAETYETHAKGLRSLESPQKVNLSEIRSSYMKYDQSNNKPLTTFYCSVWDSSEGGQFVSKEEESHGEDDSGDGESSSNSSTYRGHVSVLSEANPDFMSISVGQHVEDVTKDVMDKNNRPKKQDGLDKDLFALDVCKLAYGQKILGVDFFTGTKVQTSTDVKDLESLVKVHNLATTGMPAMVCVAVHRQTLGSAERSLFPTKAEKPDYNNLTNAMSIASIILWPDKKVSLYTGGDAEGDAEDRLSDGILKDVHITVIKAGHHGSALGTTPKFVENTSPRKVVFSAGDIHRHPHWSRLAYLHVHYALSELDGIHDGYSVYSTCYPYWFILPSGGKYISRDQINLDYLDESKDKTNPRGKIYRDALEAAYKKWSDEEDSISWFPNLFQAYKAWKEEYAKEAEDSKRERLILEAAVNYFACEFWPFLSPIQSNMAAKQVRKSSGETPTVQYRMQYLWIKHRSGDATEKDLNDGAIIMLAGGKWEKVVANKVDSGRPTDEDLDAGDKHIVDGISKKHPRACQKKMEETIEAPPVDVEDPEAEEKPPPKKKAKESVDVNTDLELFSTSAFDSATFEIATPPYWKLKYLSGSDSAGFYETSDSPNDFIRSLRKGFLLLKTPLQVLSDANFTEYALSESDEVKIWLRVVAGVTEFQLSAMKLSTDDAAVRSARLTLEIPRGSQGTPSGADTSRADPLRIELSTSQDALRKMFGEASSAITGPKDSGYIPSTGALIFAMTSASNDTLSFTDIFRYIGLKVPWYLGVATTGIEFTIADHTTANHQNDIFSALWFCPGDNYKTVVKLAFVAKSPNLLKQFLSDHLPDVDVANVQLQVIRKCDFGAVRKSSFAFGLLPQATLIADITLIKEQGKGSFKSFITFEPEALVLLLRWDGDHDPLSSLLPILQKSIEKSKSLAGNQNVPPLQTSFNHWLAGIGKNQTISLREVTLRFANGIRTIHLIFEVEATIGVPPGKSVPLYVFFAWDRDRGQVNFKAQLWPRSGLAEGHVDPILISGYSPMDQLKPKLPLDKIRNSISLLYLIPGHGKIDQKRMPACLNTVINDLELDISNKYVSMYAGIQTGGAKQSLVPTIELDDLDLRLKYTFADGTNSAYFDLEMNGALTLTSRLKPGKFESDAQLLVSVIHNGEENSWTISASVSQVSFASLYDFFSEGGEQDAIMDMMEQLYVPSASVTYDYTSATPSQLTMEGAIVIGRVELDLKYVHKGPTWTFNAGLSEERKSIIAAKMNKEGVKFKPYTLGSILTDVSRDLRGVLPDVVANIPMDFTKSVEIHLVCKRASSNTPLTSTPNDNNKIVNHMLFAVIVELDAFQFTFVQLQAYSPKSTKDKETIRMVKLTVDALPKINLELINELEQPFEAIDFVWTSHDLTKQQADMVNKEVFLDASVFKKQEPLRFKGIDAKKPDEVVCTQGCHFLLVLNQSGVPTVVVDYTFGATKPKTPPSPDQPPTPEDAATQKNMQEMNGDGKTTMIPVQKQINSLSVNNIGFSMGNKVITIALDAKLKLGPVGFEILGFALHIAFGSHLRDYRVSASFQGMSLEFTNPPVELAGLFRKINKPDITGYAGGIDLGIVPYKFLAAGMYGDCKGPPPYKTVFVYAKLDGPLIELEFAEINGISGGFGYNSRLRIPDVHELKTFPFLSSAAAKPDPMDQLTALTDGSTWITPAPDSLWLTAGLGVKAFQLVDIQAIVAVGLGAEVNLSVIAEATAMLPKGAMREEVFLLVDFVFEATMDFTRGKLEVAGMLTPASFVFNPSCHLQGGFALSYWFKNSGHEGDWVFTMGGYHPQFQRPDHYPRADRLRISWQYDANLSIMGEAYFAITPKMAMAGALIQARFEMDGLKAWFDAHADFMVNYDPFQYYGVVALSLGVSYTVDHWYCHKTFSMSFSASVTIHGPPMGGTVHVSWWVHDIDIAFGPGYSSKPAKSLPDFWQMLTQESDEKRYHMLSGEKGVIASDSSTTQDSEIWHVRAGKFAFRAQFRAAAYTTIYNNVSTNGPTRLHAKPMKDEGGNLTSEVTLIIKTSDGHEPQFIVKQIMGEVPHALWGEYKAEEDPDKGQGTGAVSSKDSNSVSAVVGLRVEVPQPAISHDPILPFDALAASSVDIVPQGGPMPQVPPPNALKKPDLITNHIDPEQQMKDVSDAWGNEKSALSRRTILDTFAGLVNKVAGPKVSNMYRELDVDAPKELLKESKELYSAPPAMCIY